MDRRRLLLVVAAVIAALGVTLVFVYARGADARAAERYDTVEVLVAAKEIKPGESVDDALENGKIVLENVPRAQLLADAGDSSEQIRGTVALTTIYAGEQLIPVKFGGADQVQAAATLPIPEGKLAISISVEDDARVGEFIRPGAQVAVFLTQEGTFSRVLLDRVQVLAAGRTTSVAGGDSGSPEQSESRDDEEIETLLTVAVSQKEAEKVRLSQTLGVLSVGLLNDTSKVEPDEGVSPSTVFE